MTARGFTLETIDIVGNDEFAAHGYPHEAWKLLRERAPVHWYDRPGLVPFWAITKHRDVVWVSRQPRLFLSAPRLAVFPEFEEGGGGEEEPFARHLLNMDPPEHGRYRRLVSSYFTPRALQRLAPQIDEIAGEIVDDFAAGGTIREADFVTEVAARLPLAVLADMLGVPREDWELLFRWTNETIGATDPEYQKGATAEETAERSRLALFEYFMKMVEERRRKPTDDITSVLANAKLDGAHVPAFELLSYFFLLVVAGNETTRNATSGGLLALVEERGHLERLRKEPALLDSAVEEILRWTTPVIQFARTAAADTEIRGQKIRAGESLVLFYPSANRDEEVFDDPFRFRIDRKPNPHLAFGIGEHHCLGANLARLELRAVFRHLVARLAEVGIAGPVERLRSSFVGGIKHIPLRYRMNPAP